MKLVDIRGNEVMCDVCGHYKKPVGRSAPLGFNYCEDNILDPDNACPGYRQDPRPGWLFQGERWSESFGDLPLPEPSECYIAVYETEARG